MSVTTPKSIAEIDFATLTRRQYTPSPDCWADQVLYFLMLDRFSDGNEREVSQRSTGGCAPTSRCFAALADTVRHLTKALVLDKLVMPGLGDDEILVPGGQHSLRVRRIEFAPLRPSRLC